METCKKGLLASCSGLIPPESLSAVWRNVRHIWGEGPLSSTSLLWPPGCWVAGTFQALCSVFLGSKTTHPVLLDSMLIGLGECMPLMIFISLKARVLGFCGPGKRGSWWLWSIKLWNQFNRDSLASEWALHVPMHDKLHFQRTLVKIWEQKSLRLSREQRPIWGAFL